MISETNDTDGDSWLEFFEFMGWVRADGKVVFPGDQEEAREEDE